MERLIFAVCLRSQRDPYNSAQGVARPSLNPVLGCAIPLGYINNQRAELWWMIDVYSGVEIALARGWYGSWLPHSKIRHRGSRLIKCHYSVCL